MDGDAVMDGEHEDPEREDFEDEESDISEPESETEEATPSCTFHVLNNDRGGRALWING